jgi:hypothetical protein
MAKIFVAEGWRRFSSPKDGEGYHRRRIVQKDFHRRRIAKIFVVGALRRTVDRPGWLDGGLNPLNGKVTVTTPAVSGRR